MHDVYVLFKIVKCLEKCLDILFVDVTVELLPVFILPMTLSRESALCKVVVKFMILSAFITSCDDDNGHIYKQACAYSLGKHTFSKCQME